MKRVRGHFPSTNYPIRDTHMQLFSDPFWRGMLRNSGKIGARKSGHGHSPPSQRASDDQLSLAKSVISPSNVNVGRNPSKFIMSNGAEEVCTISAKSAFDNRDE